MFTGKCLDPSAVKITNVAAVRFHDFFGCGYPMQYHRVVLRALFYIRKTTRSLRCSSSKARRQSHIANLGARFYDERERVDGS